GQYTIDLKAQQLPSATGSPKTPLDLLEARNAVAIAKAAGAAQYAGDSLAKAEDFLARAEDYLRRKQGRTPIGTVSRGATQMAEAEAARAAALAEQQKAEAEAGKARLAAEQAERQKEEAIRQKEEMRARLLNQLNQVLETKDTIRGLVVSMPDVLFDTGQYTLKSAARERLARVAGI